MHLNKIYISNMAAMLKKLPGALQATERRLDFVLFGGPLPLMVPTLVHSFRNSKVRGQMSTVTSTHRGSITNEPKS